MQSFRIIYPSKELQPFVRYYWILRVTADGIVSQRTLPTGCVSLIFHRKERLFSSNLSDLQPRSFICGQETVFSDVSSIGETEMIVVVFQPHTSKLFFNHPISLFRNLNISIIEIEDKELIELSNRIEDSMNNETCIKFIESFLLNKIIVNTSYYLPRLSEVIKSINSTPNISTKELAHIACLSEKQFSRVFSDNIGLSPKEFSRIIRIQRALYILQNSPRINFAQLAYDCGYTDQSHMIKEFKQFSGYTPKEFLSLYNLFSDYFSF